MTKQSKKWIELIQTIIEENGYYENLRNFINQKEKSIDITTASANLYWQYDNRNMELYKFLDTIEDTLAQNQNFNSLYEVIEYIDNNYSWKE